LFIEEIVVQAIGRLTNTPYSSPLFLRFIVAVNSNGSSSILTDLTDYNIVGPTDEEFFNNSDIEIISDYTFQLVIPRADVIHEGLYRFRAG